MGQGRHSDLALLIEESRETEKTEFVYIIDEFASIKTKKIQL